MKNILITGATSGIGLKISELLSKDNNVFLTGRRKSDKENYFACDLANLDDIKDLYKKASSYFDNKIDVLVNCAGQYIYNPIEKTVFDEINYLIDLNFKASYILCKLIVPIMKQNKWGRIVNIGSISGMVGEGNASL